MLSETITSNNLNNPHNHSTLTSINANHIHNPADTTLANTTMTSAALKNLNSISRNRGSFLPGSLAIDSS